MQYKLQQLEAMTFDNIEFAVESFKESEGEAPTKLAMNNLMSIALRECPKVRTIFREAFGEAVGSVSLGTLNNILEENELPKVTIDNAVGNNIVALQS